MVTIEDLKNPNILTQKLSEIGVSEELISHPAFYYINNIITDAITLNIDRNSLGNMVFEQAGVLVYKAFTDSLVSIEFKIVKNNANEFSYVITFGDRIDRYEFSLENGQLLIESKYMALSEKEPNKTIKSSSHRKQVFDTSGLEISMEFKEYKDVVYPGHKESWRNAPIGGVVVDETKVERKYLDVARVMKKNYGNVTYSQDELLLSGYGLRNLYVSPSIRPHSYIIPLTEAEINQLIEAEPNTTFKEGLKKYSVGRDSYYYNYLEDPIYVNIEEQELESSVGRK